MRSYLLRGLDDGCAVGAGVEGGGEAALVVPDEVGVDGHVAVGGVELEEAGLGRRDLGLVGALGDGDERARADLERLGELLDLGEVDALDLLDPLEFALGQAGLDGELRVVESEAALGFADDVRGAVFEGDVHESKVKGEGQKVKVWSILSFYAFPFKLLT